MEKHNADKYLQNQRSSLVTFHNNLGGRSPSTSNGVSTLTTIAEHTRDKDEQVMEQITIPNGYGVDPLATLVPRTLPEPLKSPDDESVVSDSQVLLCISLYTIIGHNIITL